MGEIKKIGLSLDDLYAEFTVEEGQDLRKLFYEKLEANKHHEAAMDALTSSLEGARNDPAMTHEVGKIIEWFIYLLVNRRPLFSYEIDTIFRSVIEHTEKVTVTESVRKAGSATKKPIQKSKALTCWREWAEAPAPQKKHRNKTAFIKHIESLGLCTPKTGAGWVDEFREQHPAPALEKILPVKQ